MDSKGGGDGHCIMGRKAIPRALGKGQGMGRRVRSGYRIWGSPMRGGRMGQLARVLETLRREGPLQVWNRGPAQHCPEPSREGCPSSGLVSLPQVGTPLCINGEGSGAWCAGMCPGLSLSLDNSAPQYLPRTPGPCFSLQLCGNQRTAARPHPNGLGH